MKTVPGRNASFGELIDDIVEDGNLVYQMRNFLKEYKFRKIQQTFKDF